MNQDHLELEAEWLAGEIKRALDHMELANGSKDAFDRDRYYVGVEQILKGLHNHYKLESDDPNAPHEVPQYQPMRRSRQRGPLGRIFLGDDR